MAKIYRSTAIQLDERGRRFARVTWSEEPDRETEGYRMQNQSGRPPKKRVFEQTAPKRRFRRAA